MTYSPYFSAAHMVVDSFFIDDGIIVDDKTEFEFADISQYDGLDLAISDFVIDHTSHYDLLMKDVI